MKHFIRELLISYLEFLIPIQDYLLISEILIISNYILFKYTKRKKNTPSKYPLWLLIFSAFITIIVTRLFDLYIIEDAIFCKNISRAICYYQLYLIAKNAGMILGIDLTKYINLNKPNQKNENN